jgi:hypothetical protein
VVLEPTPQLHHGSHRNLLKAVPLAHARPEDIAAIVVPSFRPAAQLTHVMDLARRLHSRLVVLCSGDAKAAEVVARAPGGSNRVYAIDLPAERPPFLDDFETTRILGQMLGSEQRDTAMKRNLGLLLARSRGWERIAFLDDDIRVGNVDHLRQAAALTDEYDVVALANDGYPDNSVVCHANRLTGGGQDTFVGAGAMVLQPGRMTSFFPEIYNEDWLFLVNGGELVTVAAAGNSTQQRYDPFANPGRARREEFGDCIAEGLFSRLDQGLRADAVDEVFWRLFLADRGGLIARVAQRVHRWPFPAERRERMLASLAAAEHSRKQIEPADCAEYLQAWQRDRSRWTDRLKKCPDTGTVHEAIDAYGIPAANVHHAGPDPVPYR